MEICNSKYLFDFGSLILKPNLDNTLRETSLSCQLVTNLEKYFRVGNPKSINAKRSCHIEQIYPI